jgi:hypothetical protein
VQKKEALLTGAIVIIAIYALSVSLVIQAYPAKQLTKTLGSSGSILTTVGVGVYSNPHCSNAVISIPWGELEPGSSQNYQVYIRNEGISGSVLSLQTSNWSPSSASYYIELGWSYRGGILTPGDVIPVTFKLTVSSSIEGITNFSFDITIVGSS